MNAPFHHQERLRFARAWTKVRTLRHQEETVRRLMNKRIEAEDQLARLGAQQGSVNVAGPTLWEQFVPVLAAALPSACALCAPHKTMAAQAQVFVLGMTAVAALVLGLDQIVRWTTHSAAGLEPSPPRIWGAALGTTLATALGLGLAVLTWPAPMSAQNGAWALLQLTPALALLCVGVLLTCRYRQLGECHFLQAKHVQDRSRWQDQAQTAQTQQGWCKDGPLPQLSQIGEVLANTWSADGEA